MPHSLFAVERAARVYQAIFLIHSFSYLVLRLYLVIVIRCYFVYFVWIHMLMRGSYGFKLYGRRLLCHISLVAGSPPFWTPATVNAGDCSGWGSVTFNSR